jgi:hypothetical protein
VPTSFVGAFFSYPYNLRGEVEDLLMDGTVHARLLDLFAGLTSTTTVRGAVYIWLYEDFRSKPMRGPVVSSPNEFTDSVHAALVRAETSDVRFIVDQRYLNPATLEAFARLKLPIEVDARSEVDDGILHSKFFTFSGCALRAARRRRASADRLDRLPQLHGCRARGQRRGPRPDHEPRGLPGLPGRLEQALEARRTVSDAA